MANRKIAIAKDVVEKYNVNEIIEFLSVNLKLVNNAVKESIDENNLTSAALSLTEYQLIGEIMEALNTKLNGPKSIVL